MKKLIIFLFILASCDCVPTKYKRVASITASTQTMMVTHSDMHDNRVSRTAGGAAIGYLLGGNLLGGKIHHGIIGGAIGYATSDAPTVTSYTKMETEITYHVKFSNGDSTRLINYCNYRVGDSIRENWSY